jgi:hypothetical protein
MKSELHQNVMLRLQAVGCVYVYHKITVPCVNVLKDEIYVHCVQQIFLRTSSLCFDVMYKMCSYFISIANKFETKLIE